MHASMSPLSSSLCRSFQGTGPASTHLWGRTNREEETALLLLPTAESMGVLKALCLFLHLSVAITIFLHDQCDARSPRTVAMRRVQQQHHQPSRLRSLGRSTRQMLLGFLKKNKKKKRVLPSTTKQHLAIYSSSDPYYVGSPFTMPPYEDVMGSPSPSSSPQPGDPFYCVYPPPPVPEQPPSTGLPAPVVHPPPSAPEQPPSTGLPAPVVYPPPSAPEQPPSTGLPAPVVYPPQFPSSPPAPPSVPVYSSPPVVVFPTPPENTPTTPNPPLPPEEAPNPPPSYEPIGGPPGGYVPSPLVVLPSPPSVYVPSPTVGFVPSPPPPPSFIIPTNPPPSYDVPSPPSYAVPGPPPPPAGYYMPSPPGYYVPSPPEYVFEPPVVYPPPLAPPPPWWSSTGLWCVAKPSVPDPIILEAMNYACGSGADCDSIQPTGSCYQPDTVIHHASYAFNSYWQRTRAAGGSCDFGGTAMLITKDPSVDGCHFITIAVQAIGGGA